ncbi:hypothetical protein KQ940_20725 [Marinobacterium sp. D7]|uniref:hypothetical protein n=1 Tax=Marinobacterium ramblicola TaxID=2849041 RepID=UPI001C2D44DA|nr:hypothetical protein [Marinobacterium ramblicola]MBV1790491.1 hypothetical protein [Marinobacterium ramblicola]
MGWGGEANNEFGIARRDIKNAASRRTSNGQYESQEQWSQRYMGERLLGMTLSLTAIVLIMVWLFDTPPLYRYGVSAGVLTLFIYVLTVKISRRNRLKRVRAQHLRELEEQSRDKNG